MAQFIKQAACFNEKGVALLENGKQHEAFEFFIHAIDGISTFTRVLESQAYYTRHHSYSKLQNPCSFLLSSREIVENETFDNFSLEDSNCNFLYNQAFRFNPCINAESLNETTVHYIKLYRAILTFNCALSFHQRSNGVKEDLKKTAERVASDLYLEAINLLKDCYSTLDSCRVLAATLNNAAMLYYELQHFSQFERFQSELHKLLVDIEASFPKSVDSRCIQFLFFNATMLNTPNTAAAA
jgi:tetratricopeptide (TPR) repeat protein